MAAAFLADVDDLSSGRDERQYPVADQPVADHRVRPVKYFPAPAREQPGVARACSDQPNLASVHGYRLSFFNFKASTSPNRRASARQPVRTPAAQIPAGSSA